MGCLHFIPVLQC
uniref:Uncharacterized protein n=1 Tax=Anguilla anguilla TaxID=7936 RepID=A0A0E9PZM8_ANGAN